MITEENWTYTHYSNKSLKALVTYGASYQNEIFTEEYFATVIDEDGHDVFQQKFNSLSDTCQYLNKRYQKIWKLSDALKHNSDKEGGCSTCVAH